MLLSHLFCCYIYFPAIHKIPTLVFQRGCGLHIVPSLEYRWTLKGITSNVDSSTGTLFPHFTNKIIMLKMKKIYCLEFSRSRVRSDLYKFWLMHLDKFLKLGSLVPRRLNRRPTVVSRARRKLGKELV